MKNPSRTRLNVTLNKIRLIGPDEEGEKPFGKYVFRRYASRWTADDTIVPSVDRFNRHYLVENCRNLSIKRCVNFNRMNRRCRNNVATQGASEIERSWRKGRNFSTWNYLIALCVSIKSRALHARIFSARNAEFRRGDFVKSGRS